MFRLLLAFHVAGGAVALGGAAGVLATLKGSRRHRVWGRVFTLGMLAVVLTTVPMTWLRPNLFLLLVGVFSGYLVLTGWRRARRPSAEPAPLDWLAAGLMGAAAVPMIVVGVLMTRGGNTRGIALVTFAGIGLAFAAGDWRAFRQRRYRGAFRIAAHLARMLAGTIAAITAFTVVNVRMEPAVVVWLAPTVLITPLIVYWSVRVQRAVRRPGPAADPTARGGIG